MASWLTRRPRPGDAQIDDEIAVHIEMAVRDRVEAGEDPAAARLAALREFGNITLTREATGSVWRRWWVAVAGDLLQDIRYAARLLARSPGFAAVVVGVLALGIGANTTVFSVFKAVYLRPLPGVAAATDLGVIVSKTSGGRTIGLSYPDYEYIRDHDRSFDGLAASSMNAFSLGLGTHGERVWGELVSGNYFQVLGVGAAMGRTLLPSDDVVPGRHPVVVISDGLWRRAFTSDPGIVGRTIQINAYPMTVVGVAARGFHGSVVSLVMDVFIPTMEQPVLQAPVAGRASAAGEGILRQRNSQWLMVIGRPKAGVSLEKAAAETRTLAAQLAADNPLAEFKQRAAVIPLWKSPYGAQTYLLPVVVLLAAMGVLILLIVCANVANLVLARGLSRRGEVAVRVALGAGRLRIIRLLLVESLLLAVPGAIAGVLVVQVLLPFASFGSGPIAPMAVELNLSTDRLAAAFALILSCASALVFGFGPAFRASRVNLAEVMKDELSPRGAGRTRLRSALVVTQLALSLLLLVGAGLVLRSLNASRTADAGFDPHHVVSLSVDLAASGYDANGGRLFYQRAMDAAQAIPGVASATLATQLPLTLVDGPSRSVEIERYQRRKDEDLSFLYNIVGPSYFETLRIDLIAGRGFDRRDDMTAPLVAVVNETFARKFWQTPQAAIGQRIRSGQWQTIVGVARDVKYARLSEDPRPHVYLPLMQRYMPDVILQVRGAGSPADLMAKVRPALQSLDANLPILDARPLDEQVRVALVGYEMAAGTLTMFGVMAALLAAIGLYGLIAYTVEQSRHEVGIYMALGASRADVLRRFLGRGLRLGVIGTTIGLAIALATARLMRAVLYGVSAMDPGTFAAGAAAILAIAAAASFVPAWRASNTDPMTALRRH